MKTRNRNPPAAILVALLAILVTAAFLWSLGLSSISGPSYATPERLSSADLAALNASATVGAAFPGNNTLWFSSGTVTMVVLASPETHHLAFLIQGLANPTVHLPAGTHAAVVAVNMDEDMYHNWALSSHGPPYSSMPMMDSGEIMSTPMLSPAFGGFWSQQLQFTATPGAFWYLCTVMGHAAEGMYGSFVVG